MPKPTKTVTGGLKLGLGKLGLDSADKAATPVSGGGSNPGELQGILAVTKSVN